MRLVNLVEGGQLYENDFHNFLAGEDVDTIYIREEDENAYHDYFISNVQQALRSTRTSTEKKTELLYDNAETIVKKVFRERPSSANIAMGEQLIENFSTHISTDKVSSHALLSLFSKDYYTFSHCVQVALLGMSLFRFMGWKPAEVADFGLGALFHDVGKNVIPDEILNKPSRLDADEFEMIKKHPLLGYQQIKSTQKMTRDQLTVVLHHHEARDGSGYPYRLKGDSIHKYARVARIVDIFDALTTKRVYKDALPRAEALRMMHDEMGRTLDPTIFDAFTKFLQAEDRTAEILQGQRINMEMGSEARIRVEEADIRMKAILVGMEMDKYLVFRIQEPTETVEPPVQGARTAVGYAHAGSLYGFESTVVSFIERPFPLLLLSYPKKVEKIQRRKAPRVNCSLRAQVLREETRCNGIIVDLSVNGCRLYLKPSEFEVASGFRMDEEVVVCTESLGNLGEERIVGKLRNVRFDQEACLLGILFLGMSREAKDYIHSLTQQRTPMES